MIFCSARSTVILVFVVYETAFKRAKRQRSSGEKGLSACTLQSDFILHSSASASRIHPYGVLLKLSLV